MTKPTSEQVTFLAAGTGATQRTALDKLRDVVSVKDFGAVGNGTTDDTAAIQACIDAAGGKIVVFPFGNYRINSTVNLPAISITIDLGKSTILPYGSSRGFYRTAPVAVATTTWASGFTSGTTVLGVGSASGMAIGQWLVIQPVTTGATRTRVAAHVSKIVDISGTNVTIADPIPMNYTGLATSAYVDIKTYTALHGDCQITNGSIDNRNSTASPSFPDFGVGAVLHGYENVLIKNVEFIGPNTTTLESRSPCVLNGPGLNASVETCRFVDAVHAGQLLLVYGYNKANMLNSYIDGSASAMMFISCGYGEVASNYVTGLQAEEVRQAASPSRSVRGIKSFGCAQLAIQDNYISGYESATKIEYTESFIVSGNYCVNCSFSATGAAPSSSAITINTGNQNPTTQTSCIISNNVVVNCGGSGIFTSDPINSIVVDGNVVRNAARYGIYVQGGTNAVVTNNSCWDCLQDADAFFDTTAVITNQAVRGVIDGNSVYSTTNLKPAAVGANVYTMIGMSNYSTTNRLRNENASTASAANIPEYMNGTVTGQVAVSGNTDWRTPTALCGVGALPRQTGMLTQSGANAPSLVAATHSGGSIATSQSLYFDLSGAAFFVVSVNNRSVLCFGDYNTAGITLVSTGTANVFTNTVGTVDRINITKNSASNQIRIQNGMLSAQSISVCAFGCAPTSISIT